ncbi:MAG: hypothetical protein C4617_04255 [Candidatus Liberibacter europaeus]|uniref:Amino acid permease n=1 Tax=Candidatus Liberibacter europaeus TaxID=744859 RepID=A0A2T4VXB1_9HYPH|nr:hypothetical protein [Candidatus Liberibacter europaeus]PTL86416.1 MAG: hypothetical protein C4617_04255 [Candidatus Liberibacter europaeus]
MKNKLSLLQTLSIVSGYTCGAYFLVTFGSKMHEINILSLLIAFIFMCFFSAKYISMLNDLSQSTNSLNVRDMVVSIQPKYAMTCTWFFYIYFVLFVAIMTLLAKTTVDSLGFIPNIVQYGLIFSGLLLAGIYEKTLVRVDVFLNIIKFLFFSSFVIAGIFFFCSHPDISIIEKNISLGTDFSKINMGILYAITCCTGLDTILHLKNDMDEKDYNRAVRILPLFVGFVFISIILTSGFIFTPEEQVSNLIPTFFKNKLNFLLISRIELVLTLIMQLSGGMTALYLALKMGKLCLPKLITEKKIGISAATVAIWLVMFFVVGNTLFVFLEIFICIAWIHFPILNILKSRQLKQPLDLKAVGFFVVCLFLLIKSLYDVIQ